MIPMRAIPGTLFSSRDRVHSGLGKLFTPAHWGR